MTARFDSYEIRREGGFTRLISPTGDLRLNVEIYGILAGEQSEEWSIEEHFTPLADGVRWDIDISAEGDERTAPIEAIVSMPADAQTRFWTAWTHEDKEWTDPLLSRPLADASWKYGPFFGTGFAIPLATVLDEERDTGFSWVISPENVLLDVDLLTEAAGTIRYRFHHHRIGGGRTVRLSMSIVRHEGDWRGGLRWMTETYPDYFEPHTARADAMAGCGSYPLHYDGTHKERLSKMAYSVYWAASYDYPYYGMWMPPVDKDETWQSWRTAPPRELSIAMLAERARTVSEDGFHYLYYFNCSEFGTFDRRTPADPEAPADSSVAENELWKDGLNYLRKHLRDSLWRDADGLPSRAGWAPEGYSFVLDPGYGGWQRFLLEQASLHNRMLPDAAGLCMDRMWWCTFDPLGVQGYKAEPVNYGADDGVGLYGNRRGSHFGESFKRFLAKLGPLMSDDGKAVFFNCCMSYRLDLYKHVDGFYDELWPHGGNSNVNGTGLLALRKPAMMWTGEAQLDGDPDRYFQKCLYMGAFVTAPVPTNDHTIQPGTAYDAYFEDYGPLLAAMVGKKWMLEPHCVSVAGGSARANMFKVNAGWAIPVVFGGTNETAGVLVRPIPGLNGRMRVKAIVPGRSVAQPVAVARTGEGYLLQAPLRRGCAMLVVEETA